MGYFQFRLCVHNNASVPETQDCFNKHVLELADGSGTKLPIEKVRTFARNYTTTVKLPDQVKCQQCVLQWHYRTGKCLHTTI